MTGPHITTHQGFCYRLHDEGVDCWRDGRWRGLTAAERAALPAPVTQAFAAFWRVLLAAPAVPLGGDQWRSSYQVELEGWRYTYWVDRHDPAEGVVGEPILPPAQGIGPRAQTPTE